MIKIYKGQKNVSFCFENHYNDKAQQIIELLAIKYFATRKYDKTITKLEYDFENKIFFDDIFLTTLIGNLLNTGLSVISFENNYICLKNVS